MLHQHAHTHAHTHTLTHSHTRSGTQHTDTHVKHIFKAGWSLSGPGTLGGWHVGFSMDPFHFPGRRVGLPWSKEKKEGGKEEAIALCVVSCQGDGKASGSK